MYNAEKYIANCLDSILNSDLPKDRYEIIVINDGSKDHGPEIAQRYAAEHSNITYFTQENQGQSVARNYGIRECHGEYVWCVDADDKVDDKISPVYEKLQEKKVDILVFGIKVYAEDGKLISMSNDIGDIKYYKVYPGRDIILMGHSLGSVCGLFLRTAFLRNNGLFFKEGITQQDVELSYRAYCHANEVVFTPYMPYIYIKHPESTSMSMIPEKRKKYMMDKIYGLESKRNLSKEFALSDPQLSRALMRLSDNSLFGLVYSLFSERKVLCKLGINESVLSELEKKGLYPLKGNFHSLKKNLFKYVLNIRFLFD